MYHPPMHFTFVVALSMLVLMGCSDTTSAPTADDAATRESNYLALGDSYTIGESVAPADRWPVQLAAALRSGGADVKDPRIIATTGWTCADLSKTLDREPAGRTYVMVSLLIGVNDQYRGGSPVPYRKAFADLLARAIALAGDRPTHVLVVSIPDWGATPFGQKDRRGAEQIGKEIDAFNAVNREESEKAGVKYVDVAPVSREATKDASLVADDGLHPSAAMYAKWTDLALPAAREIVSGAK